MENVGLNYANVDIQVVRDAVPHKTKFRVLAYVFMAMLDESTQQKGIVGLLWNKPLDINACLARAKLNEMVEELVDVKDPLWARTSVRGNCHFKAQVEYVQGRFSSSSSGPTLSLFFLSLSLFINILTHMTQSGHTARTESFI